MNERLEREGVPLIASFSWSFILHSSLPSNICLSSWVRNDKGETRKEVIDKREGMR